MPPEIKMIESVPFDDVPPDGEERFNASDIIPLADSRFLFCDNNVGDALYELRLAPNGEKKVPLLRKQIEGIEFGIIDDLEGLALAENEEGRFIFALCSLSIKAKKKANDFKVKKGARNALVRLSVDEEERLRPEIIPDFRSWLIENMPELENFANIAPDDGGLNVEGLAWHPEANVLLLGFRTPLMDGMPFVLPIRLQNLSGSWSVDNFEMLSPTRLNLKATNDEQGIRSISYDTLRKVLLLLTGNATSASKAPFSLYSWDGNTSGIVHHFEKIQFHKKAKAEGLTHGTINHRGAIVFVDDAGGYSFLWDDDPSLVLP
ncbi:DUF3616 domain-containing protein [bacterium]|nr:DUF3616 domain-containing protein [bacterium]